MVVNLLARQPSCDRAALRQGDLSKPHSMGGKERECALSVRGLVGQR
jgi:hypothetical protein